MQECATRYDRERYWMALPNTIDGSDLVEIEIELAWYSNQIDESPSDRLDELVSRRKRFISQQLLAGGRAALRDRNFAFARRFALAAQNLNLTYGLFDDTPLHTLTDINRQSQSARHPFDFDSLVKNLEADSVN